MDRHILEAFSLLRKIDGDRPAPKMAQPQLPKPPEGFIHCACDKRKLMPIQEVRYHFTGVFWASDGRCRECLCLVPNFAAVACVTCQSIVGRMPWGRLPSGLVIEKNKIYHILHCGVCKPGLKRSPLIEVEQFLNKI